jgi:hypothetical protein
MQDEPLVRAWAEACGLLGECFGPLGEEFYLPDPDGSVRLYGQATSDRSEECQRVPVIGPGDGLNRPTKQSDDGKC